MFTRVICTVLIKCRITSWYSLPALTFDVRIEGHNAIRFRLPECLPKERTTYMTIWDILHDERVRPKMLREEQDPLHWVPRDDDIDMGVEHIRAGGTYRLYRY